VDPHWRGPRTSRYLLPVHKGWAAAALAVASMLCGCSGDPGQPQTLPSLTASATAKPTATPSMTDLEAATNVVRKYFSLVNSPTTPRTADALTHLMTPSCKCRRIPASMRVLVGRKEHYFGSSAVRKVSPNINGATSADVLVAYDYTAGGIADDAGRVIARSIGRRAVNVDFRLKRQSDSWLIDRIDIVSNGRPI
jgi:hypothetical protein